MADTSLVFNIIARDSGLGRALDGVTKKFKSAGQAAEESLAKAADGTDDLKAKIAEADSKLSALAHAEEQSLLRQEAAELRVAAAQAKRASAEERLQSFAQKKVAEQAAVNQAQEKYNALLADETAKDSAREAAKARLEAAQGRMVTLLAQEQNASRAVESAINRVEQAENALAGAQSKTEKASAVKQGTVNELNRLRNALRDTGNEAKKTGSDVDRAGSVMQRAASAFAGFGSSASSAIGSLIGAAGGIGGLVSAAAQVGGALFAAVPAIYAVGGAAAALPGMLSGAIAALFTLKLGFSGLSENWKAMNAPKTGGGGGSKSKPVDLTPKIRAVEQAQRDVSRSSRDMTDAQDDLRAAQLAVAKAHETAAEKLSDLNREYREGLTDQKEAAQSLLEAQQDLNLALARGNPDEIRRAQMAVEKQALSVEDAADKADDLGKQYADASRKGVEGSDDVVDAKKAEHDAQERATDAAQAHQVAVQRLADAQKDLKTKTDAANAAGGGMAAQLPKIAASAQAFLDELKRLAPAFDNLRLDVQQRLFEGLAGKLAVLANVWLPRLHEGLGAMATMFNGVFKTAFDSLSKTDFVNNIMTAVSHATGAIGKIGQAIAGPLIDAFGRLARASGPVLDVLGTKIAGIITKFADWIKRLDESGALDRFMSKAAHVIGGVFDVMTDLARIAGDVISILFGTNLGSTNAWDNLAAVIHKIADWLGDPKVQAKISDFINKIGGLSFQIMGFLDKVDDIQGKLKAAEKWFQDFPNNVSRFLSSLPGMVGHWISSAMDQLGYWIGYGIGWAGRQFMNLPNTIYNAIRSLPGVFSNIGSWLLNAVSGLYGSMLSVGKNIVIGIWNGIASLSTWLWNKAADFARGIYRGVKDALGISSPSKVMADEVGRWIPAGIAKGMDDNSHVVQNAIGRMADMLAGATLPAPAVAGMDQAMDAVAGTLTVGARSQRIEVRQVLDVTGQEGKLKGLIREMARTGNLYQDRG